MAASHGKKAKRNRQKGTANAPALPAEKNAAPDDTGTKAEGTLFPLEKILALDDLQFMRTFSNARYLRTFGFLCNLLACLSFSLMLMKFWREPPPGHPLHGTLPGLVNILNLIFFSAFGTLFRNLRSGAARLLMRTFVYICMALLGIALLAALWDAVMVTPDLTLLVILGAFLLVFYFMIRALADPLLFGPVTVTYRQLVLIRRKKIREEKIDVSELPPCRTAGKFDLAIVVLAWITLALMFLGAFSSFLPGTAAPEKVERIRAERSSAPAQTPAPGPAAKTIPPPGASAKTVPPPGAGQKPGR